MLKMLKFILPALLSLAFGAAPAADDALFSTHLHAKFQQKSCTHCHDFHEKELKGFYYNTHASRRDPNHCSACHSQEVTGYEHVGDWFAMPGLYTSGMDAKETCEKTKEAMHAKFKSDEELAFNLQNHLFTDPRVLWGIEGATPKSGSLPFDGKEENMVKGGFDEWKTQVMAWINGGMKCE